MSTAVIGLEWEELWKAMRYEWYNGSHEWTPTTEVMWDEMLGALPPLDYGRGGFLMGEPWSHTSDDQPIYAAFQKRGEQFLARYMTPKQYREMKGSQVFFAGDDSKWFNQRM